MKKLKIGIVGAGFTGLTVGWELVKKGYQVTVFEKSKKLGGLAAGFRKKTWRWRLDNFYRHVFNSDRDFLELTERLGIKNKIFFYRPKTSLYIKGKIFSFDSPGDVLRFSHLDPYSRLRLGVGMAVLKYLPYCRFYEKISATQALPLLVGRGGYEKIWQPLLDQKFSDFSSQVPLSWFWARIKARTPKLGYYQGGFSKLVNLLAVKIKKLNGKIKKSFEVEKIEKTGEGFTIYGQGRSYSFDKIVLTAPLSVSLAIGGNLLEKEGGKFGELKMLGAAVLVLRLREKFLPDNTYWLNILEKDWPFVAVVEHTNFVNRKYYGYESIVYLGGYYPQEDSILKMEKDDVLKRFLPFAKRINNQVENNLVDASLLTNCYAQPVPVLNYSKKAPKFKTSTPGLYWLTMHHIHPWDRGVNFAIKYGKLLARKIINDCNRRKTN